MWIQLDGLISDSTDIKKLFSKARKHNTDS